MSKCCAGFMLSMAAVALTGFYLAGQYLVQTLNDWSFQMAGAVTPSMPLSIGAMPLAQQNFLHSYSMTPVHREVLSFLSSPSMLLSWTLLVCLTGVALWVQRGAELAEKNEALPVGEFQTEIIQSRGNLEYDDAESYLRPAFAPDAGLSPSVR